MGFLCMFKGDKITNVYLFYLQENVQFVTWVTSANFYNLRTDTILYEHYDQLFMTADVGDCKIA